MRGSPVLDRLPLWRGPLGDQGRIPMKRPRLGPRRLVLIGLVVIPLLVWVLILVLVPTEWARSRVVARLSAASGRSVRLGALRVGPLGGIRLTSLEIGTPRSADDPWLKIDEARID